MTSSTDEIVQIAANFAFGKPLVLNNLRAIIAEAIVAKYLGNAWRWCSEDWAPYDFQHTDGTRLEVKQSAARQSWTSATGKPSRAVWDVAPRRGVYEGSVYRAAPGRNADIYVLGHHSIFDETADHRNPRQWRFFVIEAKELPNVAQIGLTSVTTIATSVRTSELRNAVERARLNNH